MVDIKIENVPIVPENVLKYFLPNSPRIKKQANGRSGINAIYE